jgi:hypothetical protein
MAVTDTYYVASGHRQALLFRARGARITWADPRMRQARGKPVTWLRLTMRKAGWAFYAVAQPMRPAELDAT